MTRRKSVWLLVIALVLALGAAGCKQAAPAPIWQMTATSLEFRNEITDDLGLVRRPSQGYVWLLAHMTVTNITNETQDINWFGDTFKLIIGQNAYEHPITLAFSVPGYLETTYQPHQTRTGFVVFEVPAGTNPTTGRIIFDPSFDEPTITIDLKNVPVK